ncbi:hotdog fold domain-containing protein [Solimonas soli]|uniref:hotdog fold domain-containing protein n=1 Tax=Solimonas soli TaxID=413479 RepID=UPI000481F44E|nr:hotdog fold domain-containing protein [Solimonas soli]
MNPAELFARARRYPLGTRLFSRAVTWRAPYFASIAPRFLELRAGFCEVAIRDRRAVHNHLGTVNAVAMCAMCELAAGTMIDASLPAALRWIPRGMTVRYLKKAQGDLVVRATLDEMPGAEHRGDVAVPARVRNAAGEIVMEADITMYVSPKRAA